MESTEISSDKEFKINNDNIGISDFVKVIEEVLKKNNSNINNYDLILLEFFEKRNEKDVTIPNYDMLFKVKKILNYDGILAFNLRTETFHKYNDTIESLKNKYKKVIEIYLRPCSGFIICSDDTNVKNKQIYKPFDFNFNSKVIDKISNFEY